MKRGKILIIICAITPLYAFCVDVLQLPKTATFP